MKTRRSKKCRFYIVERKERKTADSTQVSVSSFTFCYFSEIWMSLTFVGLILDSRKFQTMNKVPKKWSKMTWNKFSCRVYKSSAQIPNTSTLYHFDFKRFYPWCYCPKDQWFSTLVTRTSSQCFSF